jgi:peroxiredoxin
VKALLAGIAICAAFAASTLDAQALRTGSRAPPIDLPTMTGSRIELAKLRGRPVLITFWGTWCPPCRVEFPELIRAHNTHSPEGLFILAVNGRDQERNTKDVQQFIDAFQVPFPVVLDKRGSVRRAYRIQGQPTTVFIDSSGIIRRVHTGLINRDELQSGIELILPRS